MPNINSLRRLKVAFLGRCLSRFYGRHYWPLFRKLACELAEVTLKAHLKHFMWLLAAGNLTVVEGRFPANCLLHGLEIFVVATFMTGTTCVVQCYNNKSNHRAGISLHQSLASGLGRHGKMDNVRTHTQCKFQPELLFLSEITELSEITSRTNVSRGLFRWKDPRGRSFHCPFQLYGKKIQKKFSARTG